MNQKSYSAFAILIGLLLIFDSTAFAQGGAMGGNGGDSVVCRDSSGKIISAVAFDAYEAKVRRNIDVSLDPSLSRDADVETLITRIAVRSPLRASEFRAWVSNFDQQALWLRGQELVDIPDSGSITYPSGCKIEQLIIQQEPKFPEDLRYTINGDIWEKLSPAHQAIMVLHELFIREFKHGSDVEFDTTELRYLNSMIFSDKISSLTQDVWLNILFRTEKLEYVEDPGVIGRILKSDLVKNDTQFLFLLPKASYPERYRFFIRGYEGLFIHQSYAPFKERIAFQSALAGAVLSRWNSAMSSVSLGSIYINFGPLMLSLNISSLEPVRLTPPDPVSGVFLITTKDYYNLWCPACDVEVSENEGVLFPANGVDLMRVALNKNSIYQATVQGIGPIRSKDRVDILARFHIEPSQTQNGFTVNINFKDKTYKVSLP